MAAVSSSSPEQSATSLWASKIASFADLPDKRLDARLGSILAVLADHPEDSIPQAAGSWQEAKPIYRFLENDRVSVAGVLQPIADTTAHACAGQPVIYLIQDSTSLNYTHLTSTTGLGPLNDSDHARGIHLHSTIALRHDGMAIGLLDQAWWVRPSGRRTAKRRKRRRLEQKESFKWLRSIRACQAVLDRCLPPAAQPRLVHVMDREGDIHEVLQAISVSPDSAVIRCVQNRKVAGPCGLAHEAVRATTPLGVHTFSVPRKHNQPARQATVEIRAVALTITPDRSKYPDRHPVEWTLVEVWEPNPPAGVEPLHWLLWTREPAATLTEAWAVVVIYTYRWRIEEFHLVLKSGCNAEKLELETGVRLAKAVTLYSAIAVRIVALRDLVKREPQLPCTVVLQNDEWRALWSHIHRRLCPTDLPVPTVREAVMWIGRLGGHLGRKGDGLPGVRTLWRGMRDLTVLVAGYRAGRQHG
jgi:transposase Tn5 family protein/transposase-like protein